MDLSRLSSQSVKHMEHKICLVSIRVRKASPLPLRRPLEEPCCKGRGLLHGSFGSGKWLVGSNWVWHFVFWLDPQERFDT